MATEARSSYETCQLILQDLDPQDKLKDLVMLQNVLSRSLLLEMQADWQGNMQCIGWDQTFFFCSLPHFLQ